MYGKIKNPLTGRFVKTTSRLGQSIIKSYINQLGGNVCGVNPKTNRCNKKFSENSPELCEIGPKGRCKKKMNAHLIQKPITKKMAGELLDRASIEDVAQRVELLPQLQALRGEIPADFVSQYLITYSSVLKNAEESYSTGLVDMEADIEDIRQETEEDGTPYTSEQETNDRLFFKGVLDEKRVRALTVAESYSNDLTNYAAALLQEWKTDGGVGPLL